MSSSPRPAPVSPPPGRGRRLRDATVRLWQAHAAFLVTAGVLLALVAAATAVFEELYEAVTERDGIAALDAPVTDAVLGLRAGPLTALAQGLAFSGGTVGATIVALVILALLTLARRDWTPPVLLAAAMAGSLAITSVGKSRVGRLRPADELGLPPFESSPSFPSGHTLNATVLVGIALYLVVITERVRIARSHRAAVVVAAVAAALYAVAMGLSRVYLGQHWLTDVAAGWVIGVGWVLGVVLAHRVWVAARHRPRRDVPFDRYPHRVAVER